MVRKDTEKFRLFKLKLAYAIIHGSNKITYHRTHGYFVDGISLNLIRRLVNSSTVFTVQTFMQWLNWMRIKKGVQWVPISKSVTLYLFGHWPGPVPFCISWPPNENLVVIEEESNEGLDETIRAIANEINQDLKKPDPNNPVYIALPSVDLSSMGFFHPASSVCNSASQTSHRFAQTFFHPTFQLGENHVYSQTAMTPIVSKPEVAQFSNMVSPVPAKSLKRLAIGDYGPAHKSPRTETNSSPAATYSPLMATTQAFYEYSSNCKLINFYPNDFSVQHVDDDLTMFSNQNRISMLDSHDNSNSTHIIQDSFINATSYQLDPELSGQNNFQNTVHTSSFLNYFPSIPLSTPSRTLSQFSSCQDIPVPVSYRSSCDPMASSCYGTFSNNFELTGGDQSGLNTGTLATEIIETKTPSTQLKPLLEHSVHQQDFANPSLTTTEYSQLLDIPDQAHTHCDITTPLPTRQQQQQTQQSSLWLPTSQTSESTQTQIAHPSSRNSQLTNIPVNSRLGTSSRESISTTSSSSPCFLQRSSPVISGKSSPEQIYAFLTEGFSEFVSQPGTAEATNQPQDGPGSAATAQLASDPTANTQATKNDRSGSCSAMTTHNDESQPQCHHDSEVSLTPQTLSWQVSSPNYKAPSDLSTHDPDLTHNLCHTATAGDNKDDFNLAAAGHSHHSADNIGGVKNL